MENINKRSDLNRKFGEYRMKITKMAGYLSDYYLDRAIEYEDFSQVSSFLIDYFAGSFDVGYLVSKYKEFGLDSRIEDMDFDINEWYRLKYEIDNPLYSDTDFKIKMSEEEYIQYMIENRKKQSE